MFEHKVQQYAWTSESGAEVPGLTVPDFTWQHPNFPMGHSQVAGARTDEQRHRPTNKLKNRLADFYGSLDEDD